MAHSSESVNGRGKPVSDPLPVKQRQSPRQLRMTTQVFEAICGTIGARRAETGGILGGNRQTGEVTHFYFDETPRQQSSGMYAPNTARLNEVRRSQWKPLDVKFLGLIHSHPPSFCRPSRGDEESAKLILEALEVPYILMPIVTTLVDTGSVTPYPFAAELDEGGVRIIEQELIIGGNLIRPAKTVAPDMQGEAEEYLAVFMELEQSLATMLYGAMPWAMRHPLRRQRYRLDRSTRFDYEYD
jgi:proteasome lid subunit RPN8/RPN11